MAKLIDGLNGAIVKKMRAAALEASKNAYCRYSGFRVGAAVLTEDGNIFSGCNIENASYGLTICAERNAVFQAIARGSRRIRAVVIVTPTDSPSPPCGACRQVIHEFGAKAEILSFYKRSRVSRFELKDLLPAAFGPENISPRR